jgi:hypothetical protein
MIVTMTKPSSNCKQNWSPSICRAICRGSIAGHAINRTQLRASGDEGLGAKHKFNSLAACDSQQVVLGDRHTSAWWGRVLMVRGEGVIVRHPTPPPVPKARSLDIRHHCPTFKT